MQRLGLLGIRVEDAHVVALGTAGLERVEEHGPAERGCLLRRERRAEARLRAPGRGRLGDDEDALPATAGRRHAHLTFRTTSSPAGSSATVARNASSDPASGSGSAATRRSTSVTP